jgi:hypothetical protein
MAVTVGEFAKLCAAGGLRHHHDAQEGVVRVVLVTKCYVNPRGERLAIVRIEAADAGARCRVVLERAFAGGQRPAATCLAVCQATSDVPFVRIEHDQASRCLRLVAGLPIEDGQVTARQLFALVDGIVAAAEAGHRALAARKRGSKAAHRGAA